MLKKIVSIALSIGVFYSSHSFGLTQDFNEGVDYYKAGRYDLAVQKFTIGAKAGDPASQSLLASMYSQGQGVPEDKREAVKWNRMAAVQGNIGAQYNLALSYAKGQGVSQDYFKAYMWVNVAVSGLRGWDSEEMVSQLKFLKKIVEPMLTPKQLEMAQKMSNECMARDFKGCT